jgi:hypothetical protein
VSSFLSICLRCRMNKRPARTPPNIGDRDLTMVSLLELAKRY